MLLGRSMIDQRLVACTFGMDVGRTERAVGRMVVCKIEGADTSKAAVGWNMNVQFFGVYEDYPSLHQFLH